MTSLHALRTIRDICAQARRQPGDDLVLDNANDAWVKPSGVVADRNAPRHVIGNVSHLFGAARVSAALRIVADHRAAPVQS